MNSSSQISRLGLIEESQPALASHATVHKGFSFPGDVASVPASRDQVIDFVREYCWNEADEIDLLVALQEGLANAALHGCGGDAGKTIRCSVEIEPARICIVISDPGPGFDVERLANPKYFDTTTREHGRGIALMRGVVDEVEYRRGGSELRLCKHLTA